VAKCFISYSSDDCRIAEFVEKELRTRGIEVFLAALSLKGGDRWTERIWGALRESSWVILLASKSACNSPYVQQEFGGAAIAEKKIVPIVWDTNPSELPGWMSQYHAIDLRGGTIDDLRGEIETIAGEIKAEARTGFLVAGATILALLFLGMKK
jgi:hypothetical protein